jgi:anti-anti-sigma regulatory factor
MTMRCQSCPLTATATEPLDQVFTKIARCHECDIEPQGSPSRTLALLREAGKESRKQRAEINRLKQELVDFQDGSNTDRLRIERLERLHAAAIQEVESALAERDELVKEQVAAIRALSSPLLEVATGLLAVPIIGRLSEERAHDLMHDLLTAIISRSTDRVVLDLTGLDAVDEITAERIASLCKAVALIGASVVISGLRPEVVRTLVAANIDFSAVKTVQHLKDAILRKR